MADQGKIFEAEIADSFKDTGFFTVRIPDKLFVSGGKIFSKQSESDYWAFIDLKSGFKALLVEAKAIAAKSIPFSRLEPHQKDALVEFSELHEGITHGYVAVNFYDPGNKRALNEAFFIPIALWNEFEETYDRKSLPMSDCLEHEDIIRCVRTRGSKYDLLNLRMVLENE